MMKAIIQFHEEAEFLRESSGSTNIKNTLLKALKVFRLFHIPHYVCRGFAVQEHGYPRFTVDVDIIVPDVQFAIEKLSLNGFKANSGSKMTVTDRELIFFRVGRNSIPDHSPFPCLLRSLKSRKYSAWNN